MQRLARFHADPKHVRATRRRKTTAPRQIDRERRLADFRQRRRQFRRGPLVDISQEVQREVELFRPHLLHAGWRLREQAAQ